VFRQAIVARPEAAGPLWRAIGDTLRDHKRPAEAGDAYRKAIAAHRRQASKARPERAADILSEIAITLLPMGKPDEAVALYRQAIAARPKDAATFLASLGALEQSRGRTAEAIAAYRAIEAIPKNAQLYFNIAGALRNEKKLDEALAFYRQAIKLKADDPDWHRALGHLLRDQKKLAEANAAFDRAIELYRKAPNMEPADRDAFIGAVLLDKGELDEAICALRKAFDSDPAPRNVRNDLIRALHARGRAANHLDVYRKAIEADPNNADYYDLLGRALVGQG